MTLTVLANQVYFLSVFLILVLVSVALSQTGQPQGSKFLASVYESWLKNLPPHPKEFNPAFGGQNWTTCCALAINETVSIDNGTLYIRPNQTFFRGDLSDLERFPRYPCTATFNGSSEHPDQLFWTPYTWCAERCPGWAVTPADDFDNWVKPLISFILPSLVFALNVPRRRKTGLPKNFFSVEALSFGRLVWFGLKVPLAVLIIILDLLLWLSIIFSIAGPVIMSGMYEAILDTSILDYIGSRINNNTLSLQQRTHALLVVLPGNLDFDPAWNHSVRFVQELSPHSPRQKPAIMSRRRSSASVAVDNDQLRPLVLPQSANPSGHGGAPTHPTNIDLSTLYTPEEKSSVKAVKIKLDAMLASQTKFGSAVGAPILFYIGAFIYSVFDVESDLGNYLIAHQLAFGNNPSIWQTAWQDRHETSQDETNDTQTFRNVTGDGKLQKWPLSIKKVLVRLQAPLLHPLQQSYNPTHSGSLYRSA
ncbi:hypothetical protein FLONG3_4581 [Fusarium longipes]|uniref:Uncharacterized protein n=1 Tax=Fusarium longipes TaxID=694270 RepID=A0A395SXT7_9HYPO|nr:hypothetical protein FLONG3_4581 [Fusarium longipes]